VRNPLLAAVATDSAQPQNTIDIKACADPAYDFVHADFWLPEAPWEGAASGVQ
jgi:hypothetical protein